MYFCSFLFNGPEDSSKYSVNPPLKSTSMSSSEPLNSISPSSPESHLMSLNSDSNERSDKVYGSHMEQFMRHPTKPSNYIHMSPTDRSTSENRRSLPAINYVNHTISPDMKAPVENYENTGFNALKIPPRV